MILHFKWRAASHMDFFSLTLESKHSGAAGDIKNNLPEQEGFPLMSKCQG